MSLRKTLYPLVQHRKAGKCPDVTDMCKHGKASIKQHVLGHNVCADPDGRGAGGPDPL